MEFTMLDNHHSPAAAGMPNISRQIWDMKYRLKDIEKAPVDLTVEDTWSRIARALAVAEVEDVRAEQEARFYKALEGFRYLPAGRITAGSGTGRSVTLFNCFVMGTVPDSMEGIFDMLKEAALTMQQGGGIGYDFSTIRPKGARVNGVGSDASGPLSFMDVWDAMCGTIMSAGSRRGAMMATMRCDHPDIEDFITAKRDPQRLRKFNLSVLITDAFMAAVEADAGWDLTWNGEVMRSIRAADLWNKIMVSTYAFAEPGVIFIDRINQRNPLAYIEKIAATNPCVPAGTPILTRSGWQEIDMTVDTPVEVWNGSEWSLVTPRVTGHDQPMVRVALSNGRSLICTTAHRFLTAEGARVDAAALRPGQALLTHDWPVVQAGSPVEGAYAQGMRAGGAKVTARVAKKVHALAGDHGGDAAPDLNLLGRDELPHTFVPGADWDVPSRLEWVAGLIDTSAAITERGALVRSRDRGFLDGFQLLLNTLGASATITGEGDLLISTPALAALAAIGLPTLATLPTAKASSRSGEVRVLAVEPLREEADVVYCFTEDRRHAGCFNGVLTGQCGEQPLPPYGACLLGSINMARLIINPFADDARLDEKDLFELVATAVRMMDNVVDVSRFPLPQQQAEAKAKRRIGLGVTGLADALLMLRLTYGTEEAAAQVETWMRQIQHAAYWASVQLAKEKGAFPLFDAEKYLASPTIQDLDQDLQEAIREHGIRNALLTSIAPTGTISLYAGNVSSGIEPVFAYAYKRKITLDDGSKAEEEVVDYAVQLYRDMFGADAPLPEYFVSAQTLKPLDHVRMQAAAQKWVDSSISKTVNCPEDISFEDFKAVYVEAFRSGCKGCTTYRPNDITGSILSVEPEKTEATPAQTEAPADTSQPMPRDPVLEGRTYKIKWPGATHAYYMTVNDTVDEAGVRRPFEVFVNTQNTHDADLLSALTRMISAVFRRGGEVGFVAEELSQIVNPQGGHWVEGRYVPSLVALIGHKLFEHMGAIGFLAPRAAAPVSAEAPPVPDLRAAKRTRPGCDTPDACDLVMESGCEKCISCGWSKCG
jgi:ribonucleoside-diphosphate reductase alpha chain